MCRIALILPTATYRAADFLDAAAALGAEVVVVSEHEQTLDPAGRSLAVDLCDPARAATQLASFPGLDAVIGVDDQGILVAALASARLGLPHNDPSAVALTRDKIAMRTRLGRPPNYAVDSWEGLEFPVVVKAPGLSASRGVIRADDAPGAIAAFERIRQMLDEPLAPLLVEEYIPGDEFAIEGILRSGRLTVLAIFDKPDPLTGPYFEETIYVTPSRQASEVQSRIAGAVTAGIEAAGLTEGPVHAEVRVNQDGAWLLEVAARSIGGLCSRILRFGLGVSLEEVIIRHALGLDLGDLSMIRRAAGVMMIPISSSGVLRSVSGREAASGVAGVSGVEITIPVGARVVALPEGDRYLGFIFASGSYPAGVERSLREAHSALRVEISNDGGYVLGEGTPNRTHHKSR